MDKNELYKWIESAESDRNVVYILNEQYKKPYEIICFHCEQAVEKYLKTCLILYGLPIIKTHDLIELNLLCRDRNKGFLTIEKECSDLINYAVQVRYPTHKFDLTENDVKRAIKSMEKICNFIINILENENIEEVYENKNAHKTIDHTIELDEKPIIETENNNNNSDDEEDELEP